MKTLLVPVDLTAASDETVRFTTAWSKQYDYERIILLKTFYENVFSDIVISAEYAPVDEASVNNNREAAKARLQELAEEIVAEHNQVQVTIAISEDPILRAINEIIHTASPSMIVLGSNNTDGLIARNLISIAKTSPIRVLVVPAGYSFQPVKKALVPFDFKALQVLGKLQKVAISPNWPKAQLLALNVSTDSNQQTPDEQTTAAIHEYLSAFRHEIHYSKGNDIIESVTDYTKSNDVQLVVALPGKHSFLYALTHKSISEAITRAAQVPVLILK
ncbi:universal stress protein [Chitinophaga silvatica]|nr:universal stress protein [Chitinophaga silvatica]